MLMFEDNSIASFNLCIWDESGPLICPQPCTCFWDSSGRNHLVWLYSGGTLDEREIKKGHKTWLLRVIFCASALKSHLYEDSTQLHRRCLKSQCSHGLQMEWRVSTSQQSEGTYPQTKQFILCTWDFGCNWRVISNVSIHVWVYECHFNTYFQNI